jgi:hypothetical protein
MKRLINNKELSDIVFVVEGRTVFASKVILWISRKYLFAVLLRSTSQLVLSISGPCSMEACAKARVTRLR